MKDLTVGKPSRVLILFCIPLFLSVIFQQLYSIADSVVAGNFISQEALAAVGNSYEITLIYLSFAFGCNVGGSVLIARLYGSKNYRAMKSGVSTVFITTAIICLILMVLGLIFGEPLLDLMHTPENIMEDSWTYLRIYTISLPFVFFYNLATGLFAAMGDSKTPFIFLAISSISNITLDVVFVARLHLGIAGLAWATLLCQGVAAILAVFVVFKKIAPLPVDKKPQKFSRGLLREFFIVAIPSTLQQSFISVGNLFIQSMINSFGSVTVAGYSAAVKLQNMVVSGFTTVGNGISNYTAQNYGAKKYTRISQGLKAGILMLWVIAIPFSLFFIFGGHWALKLFLPPNAKGAMKVGQQFLNVIAPFYVISALKLATDGVLRGLELMRSFMIATFVDLFLRVILASFFSPIWGSLGIWYAWPVGWIISTGFSVGFYFYYKRKLGRRRA